VVLELTLVKIYDIAKAGSTVVRRGRAARKRRAPPCPPQTPQSAIETSSTINQWFESIDLRKPTFSLRVGFRRSFQKESLSTGDFKQQLMRISPIVSYLSKRMRHKAHL